MRQIFKTKRNKNPLRPTTSVDDRNNNSTSATKGKVVTRSSCNTSASLIKNTARMIPDAVFNTGNVSDGNDDNAKNDSRTTRNDDSIISNSIGLASNAAGEENDSESFNGTCDTIIHDNFSAEECDSVEEEPYSDDEIEVEVADHEGDLISSNNLTLDSFR